MTSFTLNTVNPDGNNTTDTTLQITGNSATVLGQTSPVVTPPAVAVTKPADGATVSGSVTLSAAASATAPATVTAVQFLLDGQPPPLTVAPYSFTWTVGSTLPGSHTLSAQATDSACNIGTAAPVTTVAAINNGGLTVERLVTMSGSGAVTTAPFSTSASGETLLAFVGTDGRPARMSRSVFGLCGVEVEEVAEPCGAESEPAGALGCWV